MRKKNILYISYDGMTDPLGQSQVIPYLQGLSQEGYYFTLISFEKANRYKAYGANINKLLTGSNIKWTPLKYHKTPPVLSTMFDLWMMWNKAKRLHNKEQFQIIHCRSYLAALVGLKMKEKFGTKFLFDMRGFWADERVEGGIWNLKFPLYKLIYKYFKGKEKELLEEADYTISLTEEGKKEIHSWEHIRNNPTPIEVIPCCAELEHFNRKNVNPDQVEIIREKLGISTGDFVLLYLGSLGTWYMLDEMLDFYQVLQAYRTNARFLFLTRDSPDPILNTAVKKGISKDNIIITPVERKALPNHMALANLSIFFIKPVFSKKASSPTKQGELMGMGIPIVCNAGVGDTANIIKETKSGAVVADFSVESYREICSVLVVLQRISPSTIQDGATKYYSLKQGVVKYINAYAGVLENDEL